MGDLTVIMIGISMVVLSWTVAKINDKLDRQIRKFKRFEEALKKNATGKIKCATTGKIKKPQDVYTR